MLEVWPAGAQSGHSWLRREGSAEPSRTWGDGGKAVFQHTGCSDVLFLTSQVLGVNLGSIRGFVLFQGFDPLTCFST